MTLANEGLRRCISAGEVGNKSPCSLPCMVHGIGQYDDKECSRCRIVEYKDNLLDARSI